jgi:ribosomal-protein-serine acetyltransferase
VDNDWPPRPLNWPGEGLTDGAVVLDRMTPSDVPALVKAIDDEILRWLPLPSPYTDDDALAFLGWQHEEAVQGRTLTFALRAAADGGELLGSIGLHLRDGRQVGEIGYWVAPGARGRGLAAAGTLLLAAYGFTAYDLRRVELLIQPRNLRSRRAAERAGATFEGVRRAAILIGGEPREAAVYAFLPDDAPIAALRP